jgi:hypothetical protein
MRRLVTSLKGRDEEDRVEVLDAAYWVKGCSSLGRLRFSVLIGIGRKKKRRENGFCLIDIKEAVPAAAPRSRTPKMPSHNAERIVQGARMLSPYLGERMLPWRFLNSTVVKATLRIGSEKEYRAGPRSRLDGRELSRASFSGGNGVGDFLFITRTGKSCPKSERDSGFFGTKSGSRTQGCLVPTE